MKLRKITKLFVLAFFALIVASSCVKEGPMGPGGLDGADGANGADGSDGTNGVDGNVTCLACHSKANMDAVNAEYETSTHGMSGMMYNGQTVYIYAGAGESRKDCAVCHTHEGFVETQFTGRDTLTAALDAPTRIGCETCHGGHVSFDFENDGQDYALRTTAPVELAIAADGDQPVNVSPTSNLCINCHQSRTAPTEDEDQYDRNGVLIDPAGDGMFSITSVRYGPHHGPQGNLLEGIDGYEIAGTETYPGTKSYKHRESGGCTFCHMADGDHTFEPSLAKCQTCHTSATDFDIKGIQTEVEELLTELHGLLEAKGTITSSGSTVSGTYSLDLAGVTYNYKLIEEDRSMGMHNPEYVLALLKNSIESLK